MSGSLARAARRSRTSSARRRRQRRRGRAKPTRRPPSPCRRAASPCARRRCRRVESRICTGVIWRIADRSRNRRLCAGLSAPSPCLRCPMSGDSNLFHPCLSRRGFLAGALALAATPALARSAGFDHWVSAFRPRALARGIRAETYDRVMAAVTPDTSVYEAVRAQPEFTEQMWQYINRRCSDWRVITGKERAREYAQVLARVEAEYGVDRHILLGLWGMESSFGDVITNPKYMRPIIPALAALAYGEPRRRRYWEAELLNALTIVERGWAQPKEMIGSWAGAMGHTQWMPEVWLHMGVDFDRDGRVNPFGKPDDAFAGTAHYLVSRGRYRRGEAWGCEVTIPS